MGTILPYSQFIPFLREHGLDVRLFEQLFSNWIGLRPGDPKVCALIAAARESGLEPIGAGVAESKGITRGAVVNLEAAVEAIKKRR